jgi:hypothetical protein
VKEMITVVAFCSNSYDHEWPERAPDFLQWLISAIDGVPEDHRGSAKIEFGSDYESSSVKISVTYVREETDQEAAHRTRAALIYAEATRAKEIAALKQLLKKHGNPEL